MHWKKLFPSEHLESIDVGAGMTLKIINVESHTVEDEKGKEQGKALIRFTALDAPRGFKKSTWIAPKTCALCLMAMFGEDTAGWIGRRVTVHSEKVDAFGDVVDAVRISGSPDLGQQMTIRARKGRKKVTIVLAPTFDPSKPAAPKHQEKSPEAIQREILALSLKARVEKGEATEADVRRECEMSKICSEAFVTGLVGKLFPVAVDVREDNGAVVVVRT